MNNFVQTINKALNKAFGNTCILLYCVNTYNFETDTDTEVKYSRSMICDEPRNVNTQLVDGVNYIAGDLIVPVDYQTLIDTRNLEDGEPSDLFTVKRPFDIATCGVETGTDKIKISSSSIEYTIVAINPKDFIGNEPASYEFVIRR